MAPDVSGEVKLPEDFCVFALSPRKLNDKVYPQTNARGLAQRESDIDIDITRSDDANQINLEILKDLISDIPSHISYKKTL